MRIRHLVGGVVALLLILLACRDFVGPSDDPTFSYTAPAGMPYGPFNLADNISAPFTMDVGATGAGYLVSDLNEARSRGLRRILMMTGGGHSNYMSTIDGVYQFDMKKWKAKMNTYNTASIKDAVAKGVTDGTIVGESVMDEPHVFGSGGGNTWGPKGTMTKARVDSMCAYVKGLFPTMAVGVVHRWDVFDTGHTYKVCDFILSQYSTRLGSVTAWRDGALTWVLKQGHPMSIGFSMNILNGGTQDKDGTWDCKDQGGFKGDRSPNCAMTGSQLRTYGYALGPAGCAMAMWKHDDLYYSKRKYAMQDLATMLKTLSAPPCRKGT